MTFAGHTPHFNLTLSHTPHIGETLRFAERLVRLLNERSRETSKEAPTNIEALPYGKHHSSPRSQPSREADVVSAPGRDNRVRRSPVEGKGDLLSTYQLASIHEHTNAVLVADAGLFYLNQSHSSCPEETGSGRAAGSGEQMNEAQRSSPCADASHRASFSDSEGAETKERERQDLPPEGELRSSRKNSPAAWSCAEVPGSRSRWHTHIDFERFFELAKKDRKVENYRAVSPSWALANSALKGFDYTKFDVQRYLKQIAGRPHNLINQHSRGEEGSDGVHTSDVPLDSDTVRAERLCEAADTGCS